MGRTVWSWINNSRIVHRTTTFSNCFSNAVPKYSFSPPGIVRDYNITTQHFGNTEHILPQSNLKAKTEKSTTNRTGHKWEIEIFTVDELIRRLKPSFSSDGADKITWSWRIEGREKTVSEEQQLKVLEKKMFQVLRATWQLVYWEKRKSTRGGVKDSHQQKWSMPRITKRPDIPMWSASTHHSQCNK